MAKVVLEKIAKQYTVNDYAVKDMNLVIDEGEFIVLVGPSGCGKSTTLRMIAGLEEISEGKLYIDGDCVNEVEAKDRNIAMVFQNYALYPHLNVFDNMAFPLRSQKRSRDYIKEKVSEVAEVLQLEDLLKRKPSELSGGQRQRVALGRAMVREPKLFLFDEPLSNLDTKLRVDMRYEIANIHQRLKTTFIYVTHDQTEAMTLGDRIVVMNNGRIEQVDTPMNVYLKPQTKFVAEFLGSPKTNIIEGHLHIGEGKAMVRFGDQVLVLGDKLILQEGLVDQDIYLGFRPQNTSLSKAPTETSFEVTMKTFELMGSEVNFYYTIKGVDGDFVSTLALEDENLDLEAVIEGQTYYLSVDPDKIYLFDKAEEKSLLKA